MLEQQECDKQQERYKQQEQYKQQERYKRNYKTISLEQQQILAQSTVTVIGCGGLGGFIIEGLARSGVGRLRLVDFDTFDVSNLNRQLFSTEQTVGASKLEQAVARVQAINSSVHVEAMEMMADLDNLPQIIQGSSVVVDAVDAIDVKIWLEQSCNTMNIPLIYGAIGGNYGQMAVSLPGCPVVSALYREGQKHGIEKNLGNPYYTPCVVGGMMVKLAFDVLFDADYETGGFYFIDLDSYMINFISTKGDVVK